jgi:hypothetical protein
MRLDEVKAVGAGKFLPLLSYLNYDRSAATVSESVIPNLPPKTSHWH